MQSRQKHVKEFNRNWPVLLYHLLTALYYNIQKLYYVIFLWRRTNVYLFMMYVLSG